MSHAEILIPFGLPPAALAPDLLQQLHTPALAMIAARAARQDTVQTDDKFARSLPHERWLADRCRMPDRSDDNSPPLAPLLLDVCKHPAAAGYWFLMQPVHIHIARDHLVLTDPAQLALAETDSRALYELARPLFDEAGLELVWGDSSIWFLRADDWRELRTATLDSATGHNVDIWMPDGPPARAWRKIQNEVQMHWYGHPVNEQREARGLRPVNSLWLWAGGSTHDVKPAPVFSHACNLSGASRAIQAFAQQAVASDTASTLPRGEQVFAMLDALRTPWLGGDWGSWLATMQAFEDSWFQPLLDGVKSGIHQRLSILLSDDTRLLQLTISRAGLRKFWRKPGLAPLLPLTP